MGRFSQKYSDQQRRAVALAIVDGVPGIVGRGKGGACTAPQAVELAREGQLPGVAPFVIHLQTARGYAQAERQRRTEQEVEKLRGGAPGILDGVALRLARLADRQARALERAADGGKLDLKRAQEVAKLCQEARKATGQTGATKPPGGGTADHGSGDTTGGAGLLSTLAQQEASRRPGERRATDPPNTPTDTGTTDDTRQNAGGTQHHAQHGTQTEHHAQPVSSGVGESSDAVALAQAVLSGGASVPTVAG